MSTRSQLCVTVTGPTPAEICHRRDVAVRDAGADLVELRLDTVVEPGAMGALQGRSRPVIVTCRPTWEGGAFDGNETVREALLAEALERGAEYVDVEYRARFAADLIAQTGGRRIVLSLHDFEGVPDDLTRVAQAMRDTGAEVIKIAVTPTCLRDCLKLIELSTTTLAGGSKVLIGMGPYGLASRVLAGRFGSAWTYAGTLSDIGQVDAVRLINEFRFRSISEATRVYALTGLPIGHSVSPAMHNRAFKAADLDAVYLPLQAADADDFLVFASSIGLSGASVTIPFKVALAERVGHVDEMAKSVGAINTIRRAGAGWSGTNTDVAGFLRPLESRGVQLTGTRASILGAGGSARAVAFALKAAAARVTVHARNADNARTVASAAFVDTAPWPPVPGSWDILVNCTPVGMHPNVDESPLPTLSAGGQGGRLVYDLVYNPEDTRLLRDARAAGCQVIGGLEMLVAQAEEQFSYWTGRRPSPDVMREAAAARLAEFAKHENHVV